MSIFADIAFRRRIPAAHDGLFTFSVPTALEKKITRGCIVLAPLRGKHERGVVVRLHKNVPLFATENIIDVCTPSLMDDRQFAIATYVARSTYTPLARVLPLFFPKKIFDGTGRMPQKHMIALHPEKQKELPTGKKMRAVVEALMSGHAEERLRIQKKTNCAKSVIVNMIEKNILQETLCDMFSYAPCHVRDVSLSPSMHALAKEVFSQKKALLFAQRGSGVMDVLTFLVQKTCERKQSTLIIAPRLELEKIRRAWEGVVDEAQSAVFHQHMTAAEKARMFWKVRSGQAHLIFGDHTALFLPFPHLGRIILHNEKSGFLASHVQPYYHARHVAEYMANTFAYPLVFVSSVPSVELFARRDIRVFRLPTRCLPPTVHIIDMNEERKARNFSPLSHTLQRKMLEHLTNGKRVFLLLNKRGMFRLLMCNECGEVSKCPRCHVSLVTHQKGKTFFLLCHSCGGVFGIPPRCTVCGSTDLKHLGSGTANIERTITEYFPQYSVLRIDKDSAKSEHDFHALCRLFSEGKKDIAIGTQMAIEGIDFRQVSLFGVIDADAGLHVPDFRVPEKTYGMLFHAMEYLQKPNENTEMVLQTRMPHMPLFSLLKTHDTEGFLQSELKKRETFFLPPFSQIIKLIYRHAKKETAFINAREAQKRLQATAKRLFPKESVSVTVAPALFPHQQGKFVVNVLLTAKHPHEIIKHTSLPPCHIHPHPLQTVE